MARPNKQGVDYFPLDVHLDDKFKFVEIKYKLEGFAIVVKLLQKIYSCGYWYKWTDDEALLFADEIRIDADLVSKIVEECLERDIFSKSLFEKYNILTSKGIQKRYKEIVRRRKDVEIKEEYLLIDNNFGINAVINPSGSREDDDKSTQSKVKESKEKKSKQKIDDHRDSKPNPILEYEKHFGPFPLGIFLNQINDWIDHSQFKEPEAIICEVIRRAKLQTPRNAPAYIQKILKDLHNLQLYTLEAVNQYNEKFDSQIKKNHSPQSISLVRPSHWEPPKALTEEEEKEMRKLEEEFPY